MERATVAFLSVILLTSSVLGQTPQPFPRPAASQQEPPPRPAPAPQAPAPAPRSPDQPGTAPVDTGTPDAATIYFPLYPTAQFLRSYDAGRGQRYYIYGTTAPYVELVTYYRTQLKDRGDQVFVEPPTYMFSIGRFREETMAFPPGVTIKDWTWGGSQGYPNPRGAPGQPGRFPSIIMIVPPPPGTPPLGR